MRILVIEDEIGLAEAIGAILKKERYSVDIANDGQSGLEYALTDDYDCILLDIMLPKMNGLDVLSYLRVKEIETPVILLTAKSETEDKKMVSSIGKKSTTELLRDLRKYKEFDSYLKHDADYLRQTVFTEKLKELLKRDDRTRIEIAQEACISEIYLYQICTGKRVPSRERVLCLCLVLHPKLEEVQELLRSCGHAPLHPRDRRDAQIIHALLHNGTLYQTDDALIEMGEKSLLK